MAILDDSRKVGGLKRRVGMSKRQTTSPLLSTFRERNAPTRQLKIPESIEDPPLSSDDELVDDTPLAAEAPAATAVTQTNFANNEQIGKASAGKFKRPSPHISDSSGDERQHCGDIQRTNFGNKKRTGVSGRNFKNPQVRKRRNNELNANQEYSSGVTPPSSFGEQFKDKFGLTKRPKQKQTYKPRSSGSQRRNSRTESPSQSQSSTLAFHTDVTKSDEESKSGKSLRIPDGFASSPEKPKATALRLPARVVSSSPPVERYAKIKDIVGAGQGRSRTSLDELSNPFDSSQGSSARTVKGRKRKLEEPPIPKSPSPPRAVLKLPASLPELQPRQVNSDAAESTFANHHHQPLDSDDGSSQEQGADSDSEATTAAPTAAPATVCPWCGDVVDKKLLDDFAKGKRMTVRLQTKFCQKHKKQTAQDVWQQKQYPQVQWDGLDERFASHRERLLGLINGHDSHFRSIHEKNIVSGKGRSMKEEDNFNPGYYGPRGFNVMCDYLVREFGDLLKKKAVNDRVIAGRGSAAFIQTVLVAELAVLLIMDDMGNSEQEARVVLEESKSLGELIHEDA